MSGHPIPEDIRRFILGSIPSVPFLEALLLLRAEPEAPWDRDLVARRLYTSERAAEELLAALCAAGTAVRTDAAGHAYYRFQPQTAELRGMIDRLADIYARHLVETANLIHSKLDRKAQQFADAFKWRKDP